jgi:SAM-dependent methyltransferase
MKTTDEMIQLNHEQAKFYDAIQSAEAKTGHGGYAENKSANVLTRAWAGLRYRQQAAAKAAGVEGMMKGTHQRWVASKAGGNFLEFGCFSGSPSTFLLAENAGAYVGVELSPSAVKSLNDKFTARGLAHKAVAEAVDFLTLKEDRKFDLFYAHGVLHHFENPEPLFEKLAALAKPDAMLLFVEPCAVNPVYRFLRALYRPFQSDAPWEWPFRRRTVEALEKHFEVVEGFGWGRRSLPLSVMTGLPFIGRLLLDIYIRTAQAEVKQGWHSKVWHNSMVTALYRAKRS